MPPTNESGSCDLIELHVVLKKGLPEAEAERWAKGLADALARVTDKGKVEAIYVADVRGPE